MPFQLEMREGWQSSELLVEGAGAWKGLAWGLNEVLLEKGVGSWVPAWLKMRVGGMGAHCSLLQVLASTVPRSLHVISGVVRLSVDKSHLCGPLQRK